VELYTPSLDWSNEIVASLWWVAKAWVIAAVCVLIVMVLLARFTKWGRKYWRITGPYFVGRQSIPVWGLLAVLLLSVMLSVRTDVLVSYYYNDQGSSLQTAIAGAGAGNNAVRDSGIHGFWVAILTFAALATFFIIRSMLDIYLMQRFIIRWRIWLTDRLTGDWLDDLAYYKGRFVDDIIDNPDQRIQQDIDIFTTGTGPETNTPTVGTSTTLLFGAVNSIVSAVAFTPILWNLSGPLTLWGVTLPKALFWCALLYVLFATVIAFWIGRPLIRLSFRNELTNAAFRYALVRLRDAAEAVGFYRGEKAERGMLATRFAAIITNYRAFVRRTLAFFGWNQTLSQIINPLPLIIQAPRLFAGQISYGDVTQSSSAFGQVHDSLSFFRSVYDSFASYRATIDRLDGLMTSNTEACALPAVASVESNDGTVQFDRVEVRTPYGQQLVDPLDVLLAPGDALVVTGRSGAGKTTLLRSLAQLWPFASGTLHCPGPDTETMFLSQVPYVPLGDLRAVVSYPVEPGDPAAPDDAALTAVLSQVALEHLEGRLDETKDWAKVLSPGEQQRIAFARLLLVRPKAVFLDEATSALDEGQEFALYRLLRTELPECVVVSVSHRSTVEQHHNRQLELLGEGPWRLTSTDAIPTI
jgi:vitamin B12/bleomycin/antimicrobial peptide transport system ATP-binding/permease protein